MSRTATVRAAVIRRIRRTAYWELANVAWLAALVFGVIDAPFSAANLTGYALASGLLVQGAAYWLSTARRMETGRRPDPAGTSLRVWRILRVVDPAVLAVGLVVVVVGVARQPTVATVPGLCLALLAVAEYVNYFHRQLMYDNLPDLRWLFRTRRLRRSHLALDLRRAERTRTSSGR
jgi:hypothetical protein